MAKTLTLEGLRLLDTIASTGSFALAAQRLFKVPSALTYQVAKLEAGMGVALFDRSGQRAKLTPAGQLLLNRGRDILDAADHLENAVKQLDTGWEPQLRIAIDTAVPLTPVLKVLGQFYQLGKLTEIFIREEVLGGGWEALQSGRADLLIGASGELPKGEFKLQPMASIPFVLVAAPAHPLAQHVGPISGEQLRSQVAIVVADSSTYLPSRQSGLLDTERRLRVASMQAKIAAISAGIGTGFVPAYLVAEQLASGQLVTLNYALPRNQDALQLAWPKQASGKALTWFAEMLGQIDWATAFQP